jgi:hypothetical protein
MHRDEFAQNIPGVTVTSRRNATICECGARVRFAESVTEGGQSRYSPRPGDAPLVFQYIREVVDRIEAEPDENRIREILEEVSSNALVPGLAREIVKVVLRFIDGHPGAGKKLIIILLCILARQCLATKPETHVHIENLNIHVDSIQQHVIQDEDVEAERRDFEEFGPPP